MPREEAVAVFCHLLAPSSQLPLHGFLENGNRKQRKCGQRRFLFLFKKGDLKRASKVAYKGFSRDGVCVKMSPLK